MGENEPKRSLGADKFIMEYVDSIPQLEALVLLWNSRPGHWTCEELASRLYIPPDKVNVLLRDLVRRGLAHESQSQPATFSYFPRSEAQNEMMLQVDLAYRRDLVRISTLIHSKASSPVREFARAFRFTKDRS